MKRNDFIKSLQIIKAQIIRSKNKPKKITLEIQKTIENFSCICVDANGESKYLYSSQKEIEYLLASKHISLQSYPCPYEKGWHLTKG